MNPSRVSIIGATGSGKSTLAGALSSLWNLEHIELDAIHHLPNWGTRSSEEFCKILTEKVSSGHFIVDGSYSHSRPIYWERLELIILLDYSFSTVFARLFKRTVKRSFTRAELWAGNRETFKKAFLSKDSILLWCIQTHKKRHLDMLGLAQDPGCEVLHFTHPKQADEWLASIKKAP